MNEVQASRENLKIAKRDGRLELFGVQDYRPMHARQVAAVEAVAAQKQTETLFLGSHPPVVTFGRSGKEANVIAQATLDVAMPEIIKTERGGDVTFHGPGQVVAYPIINLNLHGRDLHAYLRSLEEVVILSLADFNITAQRKKDFTGVWVQGGEKKIASIGVAVRKWVSYHGFALNVNVDMRYFQWLNPCGLQAQVMTSVSEQLSRPIEAEALSASVVSAFDKVFGIQFKV